MRIIAGSARGRKLLSPGGKGGKNEIRPTSDRAREALFNILGERVRKARVLDLFAGTGALGLEALSRGADSSCFIDCNQAAIDLITRNAQLAGFSDRITIIRRDLVKKSILDQKFIPARGFSLVFMDPPYKTDCIGVLLNQLVSGDYLTDSSIVVAETDKATQLPDKIDYLKRFDKRQYGETVFWLYLLEDKGEE